MSVNNLNTAEGLREELQRVFDLQCANKYKLKNSTAAVRKQKLERFKAAILANQDAICDAMYKDLRRSRQVALGAEVFSAIAEIDDAISNLDAWMQPVNIEPSPHFAGAKTQIRNEARGQVLVLGPWNFPIGLVFQPIVPAIAAGNCVIAKPNELSPHSSTIIAKVLREAFDEKDVAVFEGGVDVANLLLEQPFNHIFFTGSPSVGRIVMAAAAKHLASVTLELGGKNPVVIDETADLQDAALKIAGGRCTNAGQLCLSPDVIWVKSSVLEQFIEKLCDAFQMMFYKDGKLNPDSLGKLIDRRNFDRVTGYITDAVENGARICCGGNSNAEERTVEPTVLTAVPLNARIMNEEIFGPLLPVLGYDDLSEVYSWVQRRGKPLATYVFSHNQDLIEEFLANTSSGGVTINGVILHCAETRLPFGGVNESGIGRYHGIHGFHELSHERAVFIAPPAKV